jgi:ankyrin repeat protein
MKAIDARSITEVQALHRQPLEVGDIDINGTSAFRPIIHAASTGDIVFLHALIEMGADINAVQDERWSALSMAASKDFMAMVIYLLDQARPSPQSFLMAVWYISLSSSILC